MCPAPNSTRRQRPRVPIPTALRMSPGTLFPASSSLHRVLLRGRQFTRARPPRRPTLFQRRSGRKPVVTRWNVPAQGWPSPGWFLWGRVLPVIPNRAGALLTEPSLQHLPTPLLLEEDNSGRRASSSRKTKGAGDRAPDCRPRGEGQCREASPSCWRWALRVRAKASSSAPLWLIWLLRRSSCRRAPLPASAPQKAANASSHGPRLFHSRVRLHGRWT